MNQPTFSKKLFAVLVAAIAMISMTVAPAFASEHSAQVAITGGTLTGGDIGLTNFTAIELDGSAKTSTATWTIGNITDATGTGAGWNVSLKLAPFKEWLTDAYVTDGVILAEESVKVTTLPSITAVDETSSSALDIAIVGANTALDTATGAKLLTSDTGEGMGKYSVTGMTVTLSVPASVRAHTYKTDATVALTVGP